MLIGVSFQVEKLARAMGEVGDVGYTCETAGHFFRYRVSRGKVDSWGNGNERYPFKPA